MAVIKWTVSSKTQKTHWLRVVELVWVAPQCWNLYRVCCVASSSTLTRSPNEMMDTCALRVCQHCSVSLVAVATRTKAPQNSTRKSLHSKTTLIGDARPATHVRHALSISTTNMLYNWINLSAKRAIDLHLAQSAVSSNLGTSTTNHNETKVRL